MKEILTRQHFDNHLNQSFRVDLAGLSLEFELIECQRILEGQPVEDGRREPFSLIFRGPGEPILAQRIYGLEHPELGRLELFLVPLGPGKSGVLYEAVFA